MKRINQYLYYSLAERLHPLASYQEGTKLQPVIWELHGAKNWLRWVIGGNLGHELVVSKESANGLINAILRVDPDQPAGSGPVPTIPPERELTWFEAYALKEELQKFLTIFAAEVSTLASYIVSKKGIYDTADLIERADIAVDETARDVIGAAARKDFREAGRCLAFELPTAAGYHTMRATEAVVRMYWAFVRPPNSSLTRQPDMAVCINELRAAGEDPKLMDALDHVKDLHRNTLMHPEAFLTMKEALRLFDIAKSSISLMGDRIKDLRDVVLDTAFLENDHWNKEQELRKAAEAALVITAAATATATGIGAVEEPTTITPANGNGVPVTVSTTHGEGENGV